MPWLIEYFNDGVRRDIEEWPAGVRASFLRLAERMVAYGPHLGMPHTRAFGQGLFEIRAKGREGIGRALFCLVVGHRIVILHGFIKKSTKTPQKELETALRRLKEIVDAH
ncbi:MAG: type II toxin-antitoxin system RelE/ParE family toxin [Burkholderiales bacterium]